jgi:tetratricopeptide (TPR) repeat protein
MTDPKSQPEGAKVVSLSARRAVVEERRAREEAAKARFDQLTDVFAPEPLGDVARALEGIDPTTVFADIDARIADPDAAREAKLQFRTVRALQRHVDGDAAGAYAEWDAILEEDPRFTSVYVIRGMVRTAEGDLAGALGDLDQAAEIAPLEANVFFHRGDCYFRLGDVDRALANFRRGLQLDPRSKSGHAALGHGLGLKGDPAGAIAAFSRALALDPRQADVLAARAICFRNVGDLPSAIRDLERALALEPKNEMWHQRRADYQLEHDEGPDAS